MKVICLALALAAVGAKETVVFNEGDAPTCEVNASGDTIVYYSDSLTSHASFKCSHDAGTCQCIAGATGTATSLSILDRSQTASSASPQTGSHSGSIYDRSTW